MSIDQKELERIHSALAQIKDPEIGISIEKLQMIKAVDYSDGRLLININLTVPGCPLSATIEKDVKTALSAIGYKDVSVMFGFMSKDELNNVKSIMSGEKKEMPASIEKYDKKRIKNIIAVYSAKGGVGKSTVVSLLALTAKNLGYKPAVLDCDISGPSILPIFGKKYRAAVDENNKIQPLESEGIKIVSIDMLIDADAIIWRGPLVSSAIKQMYNDTEWGDTDLLFLDMPPGTSDAPLTVFQSIPVDKVIVVTTPQALSQTIGMKTVIMADTLKIPVGGIIENMSYIKCPDCGKAIQISKNSTEKIEGIEVIAKLPFKTDLQDSVTSNISSTEFEELKKGIHKILN